MTATVLLLQLYFERRDSSDSTYALLDVDRKTMKNRREQESENHRLDHSPRHCYSAVAHL